MITTVRAIATKPDGTVHYMILDLAGKVHKAKAIARFKKALPRNLGKLEKIEILYIPYAELDK